MATNYSLGVLDVGVLSNTLELAPAVEALGFHHYWVAEHHQEGAIPTPLLALTLLGGITDTMRVGVAGVLLRFASPMAVAQTGRTLQWLFGGRVDIGVARGTVKPEALEAALLDGRHTAYSADDHARKVEEVRWYLTDSVPAGQPLHGLPIEPSIDPQLGPPSMWVLSTSAAGASLAARIGACYSYHDYFARNGAECIRRYIDEFRPTPEVPKPTWNVCIDAFVADDEALARKCRMVPSQPDPEVCRFFAGSPRQFDDYLGATADTYQTKNIVFSTLRGKFEVAHQLRSLELSRDSARRLFGP